MTKSCLRRLLFERSMKIYYTDQVSEIAMKNVCISLQKKWIIVIDEVQNKTSAFLEQFYTILKPDKHMQKAVRHLDKNWGSEGKKSEEI